MPGLRRGASGTGCPDRARPRGLPGMVTRDVVTVEVRVKDESHGQKGV